MRHALIIAALIGVAFCCGGMFKGKNKKSKEKDSGGGSGGKSGGGSGGGDGADSGGCKAHPHVCKFLDLPASCRVEAGWESDTYTVELTCGEEDPLEFELKAACNDDEKWEITNKGETFTKADIPQKIVAWGKAQTCLSEGGSLTINGEMPAVSDQLPDCVTTTSEGAEFDQGSCTASDVATTVDVVVTSSVCEDPDGDPTADDEEDTGDGGDAVDAEGTVDGEDTGDAEGTVDGEDTGDAATSSQ
jgi:hypothetical protein